MKYKTISDASSSSIFHPQLPMVTINSLRNLALHFDCEHTIYYQYYNSILKFISYRPLYHQYLNNHPIPGDSLKPLHTNDNYRFVHALLEDADAIIDLSRILLEDTHISDCNSNSNGNGNSDSVTTDYQINLLEQLKSRYNYDDIGADDNMISSSVTPAPTIISPHSTDIKTKQQHNNLSHQ